MIAIRKYSFLLADSLSAGIIVAEAPVPSGVS